MLRYSTLDCGIFLVVLKKKTSFFFLSLNCKKLLPLFSLEHFYIPVDFSLISDTSKLWPFSELSYLTFIDTCFLGLRFKETLKYIRNLTFLLFWKRILRIFHTKSTNELLYLIEKIPGPSFQWTGKSVLHGSIVCAKFCNLLNEKTTNNEDYMNRGYIIIFLRWAKW